MNVYQIDIYAEVPHILEIKFIVKAATKEDAEVIARKIINDLGLPEDTIFERSYLCAAKQN